MLTLVLLLFNYELKSGGMEIMETGRVIHLKDGVEVKGEHFTISSREGYVYEEEKRNVLQDSVYFRGPTYTIWADFLEYYELDSSLKFWQGVILEDSLRIIKTDTLNTVRDTATITSTLEITLKGRNIMIRGKRGIFALKEEKGTILGSPVLYFTGGDTLEIKAKKFTFASDSFWAENNVIFQMGTTCGFGDTLLFLEKPQEKGILWGNAILEFEDGESLSDSIIFFIQDEEVKHFEFTGQVDLTNRGEEGILKLMAPWISINQEAGHFNSLEAKNLQEGVYIKKE